MVALLLSQGAGEYAETCLLFILSILRDERGANAGNPGQPGRGLLLLNRTRQSVSEALGLIASGTSRLSRRSWQACSRHSCPALRVKLLFLLCVSLVFD